MNKEDFLQMFKDLIFEGRIEIEVKQDHYYGSADINLKVDGEVMSWGTIDMPDKRDY